MRDVRSLTVAALAVAAVAWAGPGQWKQLGAEGGFTKTRLLTSLDGKLYSFENQGQLFAIEPKDGSYQELGKGEYAKSRLLTAVGDSLYSIEQNGGLFQIATR